MTNNNCRYDLTRNVGSNSSISLKHTGSSGRCSQRRHERQKTLHTCRAHRFRPFSRIHLPSAISVQKFTLQIKHLSATATGYSRGVSKHTA